MNDLYLNYTTMIRPQLTFIVTLVSAFFMQNANGQDKSEIRNHLVGTWKLISYSDFDSASGSWIFPYGEHPRGYFTYTETGIVNLSVSAEMPLLFSEDSARRVSYTVNDFVNKHAFSYFGTYTLDIKNSAVTHHPKGGTIPWYVGTDQHRQFILKGDTLMIGDPTFKIGKRVLVREK